MKRIVKAALTAGSAACILVGAGSAAYADDTYISGGYSVVDQPTVNGYGSASEQLVDSAGDNMDTKTSGTFVNGAFWDIDTNYTMDGWLERSTNGGATWTTLSGVHSMVSGSTGSSATNYYAFTDNYYDGPGYLARACFRFTSWSGAATHCSPAE